MPQYEAWVGASASPGAERGWGDSAGAKRVTWEASSMPCPGAGHWSGHTVQGCPSPWVQRAGSACRRKQLFAHQGEGWCAQVGLSNSLSLFLLINKLILSCRNLQLHWMKVDFQSG